MSSDMIRSWFEYVTRAALLRKWKWSTQEDNMLIAAVCRYGTKSWVRIAKMVPGRTGKQCRERWIGQLSPQISKEGWSHEEDLTLLQSHQVHGNKWTIIARGLPGRSAISVKNRWNWLMRRGILDSSGYRARPGSGDAESTRSHSAGSVVLEPIIPSDSIFGDGFREFQARMLIGSDPTASTSR